MGCLEGVEVSRTENGAVGLAEGCEVGLEGEEEMVRIINVMIVTCMIIVVHEFVLRSGGGVGWAGEVRCIMLW